MTKLIKMVRSIDWWSALMLAGAIMALVSMVCLITLITIEMGIYAETKIQWEHNCAVTLLGGIAIMFVGATRC